MNRKLRVTKRSKEAMWFLDMSKIFGALAEKEWSKNGCSERYHNLRGKENELQNRCANSLGFHTYPDFLEHYGI